MEVQLGDDINSGITRQDSISADVRNNERMLDLKIVYHKDDSNHAHIVRINLEATCYHRNHGIV